MNKIFVPRRRVSIPFLSFTLAMLLALIGCKLPTAEPVVKAKTISAGESHTCATTTTGSVKCWGSDQLGALGDGDTTFTNKPTPVFVLQNGVKDVAAGSNDTFALMDMGGAKSWGDSTVGQLGIGIDAETSNTPFRVTPVDMYLPSIGLVAISAGQDHVCAVTTTNGVMCWGSNSHGQLGIGDQGDRNRPAEVYNLFSGVTKISVGQRHSCALMDTGGVKCWGGNNLYQIGDGTTDQRSIAVDVSGLNSGVVAVSASGVHTCALMSTGGVKCWGINYNGEIGDGTNDPRSTAVDVSGLNSGVVAISAGGAHTCALMDTGGVKCWGDNSQGQLGDGSTNNSTIPVEVFGLNSGVVAISAGGNHACALMNTGGVKCWGDNSSGQLGDGSINDRTTPVDVLSFTR